MLKVERMCKDFERLRAVDEVSLAVQAGQIVGLIGPNGSGKSTLLSLIAGNQTPTAGHIWLGNQEITRLGADAICRLGLVRSFQDPSLFLRMTVLDNALLPVQQQRGEQPAVAPWHRLWRHQERENAERAGAVLEQVKLRNHYATPAANLSGGQMKLLELGRSLMAAPKLLLLDEPTAGVAPTLAYTIFEEISRLRREQGLSFLIVEHRLEILFDFVDHLYVMHLGRVIAQGAPREIEENREVREIYFGT